MNCWDAERRKVVICFILFWIKVSPLSPRLQESPFVLTNTKVVKISLTA